jgi:protein gp37
MWRVADNSKIEWTTHTFNPWWGCARVSPGCRFCYADSTAQRYGHQVWRRKGPRRMLSDANWKKPLRWNREAETAGVRARVFCASMADVFEDHPDVVEPRARLWPLIEQTPWLDWQLLTKRPENVVEMAPWANGWPANVWLGTSVENQEWANRRLPVLREIPAKIRFLSCEPLIGPVDLTAIRVGDARMWGIDWVDWVIVGGESGAKARHMDVGWALSLVEQCRDRDVPVHVKQLGSVWARGMFWAGERVSTTDPKGGDWTRWPSALRVREYPVVTR